MAGFLLPAKPISPLAPPFYQLADQRDPAWRDRYFAMLAQFDFVANSVWSLADIKGRRNLFLDPNKDYTLSGEPAYWQMIDQVNTKVIQLYRFFLDTQFPLPERRGPDNPTGLVDNDLFAKYNAWTPFERQKVLQDDQLKIAARAQQISRLDFLKTILTQNEYNEWVYWAQGQSRTSTSYGERVGNFIAQAGGTAAGIGATVAFGYAVYTAAGAMVGSSAVPATVPPATTPIGLPALQLPSLGQVGTAIGTAVVDQGKKEIANLLTGKKQEDPPPANAPAPAAVPSKAVAAVQTAGMAAGVGLLVTVSLIGLLIKLIFFRK